MHEPPIKLREISRRGWAWASLDFARSPYYYIVVVYVFSTYFASTVIGDGARGQSLVSLAMTIAGGVMAIIAPMLGATIDNGGRRKPILAFAMIGVGLSSVILSQVHAGAPGAIVLGMTFMIIAACAFSVTELIHNSMLANADGPKAVPIVSGLGLTLGSTASTGILVAVIVAIMLNVAPAADVARLSAGFVGLWLLIFMWPYFAILPDENKPGNTWRRAFADLRRNFRISEALTYVKSIANNHPRLFRFLISRMIFMDGIIALFTIGAVYVAGVLDWNEIETTGLGVLATFAAILGGLLAGQMDTRLGPIRALKIELTTIALIFAFQLGITPTAALYGAVSMPGELWEGPYGATTDLLFIVTVLPMATLIVASISSSRSLLVSLAPPDRLSEFFGIFAMTATVTVWLGPGLVALVTALSGSQQIGYASLLLLFAIGLWGLRKL